MIADARPDRPEFQLAEVAYSDLIAEVIRRKKAFGRLRGQNRRNGPVPRPPCSCNAPLTAIHRDSHLKGWRVTCTACGKRYFTDVRPAGMKNWSRRATVAEPGTQQRPGRKRGEPCTCINTKYSVAGYTQGLYRVRCRACSKSWVTAEPPRTPKFSRANRPPKPPAADPPPMPKPKAVPPPTTAPIGRGWTEDRRQLARERALLREGKKFTTASPPDARIVEGTFYELSPDEAARYRELRLKKQRNGEAPELLHDDGVIPA